MGAIGLASRKFQGNAEVRNPD